MATESYPKYKRRDAQSGGNTGVKNLLEKSTIDNISHYKTLGFYYD